MRRIRWLLASIAAVALVGAVAFVDPLRGMVQYSMAKARGGYTVEERVAQFGSIVERRLRPSFEAVGASYPPEELALLAFKDSRTLEVYARVNGRWRFVKSYRVLAASGQLGPKLREGDQQVPEGVYRVESLNPNSRFHLSVRLNYPNEFDRRMAQAEGRTHLGGDIMIHGNSVSVGCLAMGDEAAEDLFVLSALVGKERMKVVISPTDFRAAGTRAALAGPSWIDKLYGTLREELRPFIRQT
jgi:hypothetical protein